MKKDEAVKIAAAYNSRFGERCLEAMGGIARSGATTATFGYGMASAADVDAAVALLQAAGWTCSKDDPNKTLTVSDK